MTGSLSFLEEQIRELKEQDIFRPLARLSGPQGSRAVINGKEVVNLSSNNYLGLSTHPHLIKAAVEAALRYGVGSGAVRTIIGTMEMHLELERKLAEFKHTEAVLVFQSGFTANSGCIPALVGKGDCIISDDLNHASIIDGARLSRAEIKTYPHRNMAGLDEKLQEAEREGFRKKLVITDGVFSMDGDIAPLPQVVELCEKYGAISYVDDAHASGVLGKNGRGTVDHFGLHGRVDVQIGTLSKAFGSLGGYIAGPKVLIDWLTQRGRPFLFSTSHPPAVTAACLAAIDVLLEEPQLIDRLWENAHHFKAGLKQLGFDVGFSETPITPVIIGKGPATMKFADRLFEEGVFAQGITYPTVAPDKSRLRTIVTAGHTEEDLDFALSAFEKIGRELKVI